MPRFKKFSEWVPWLLWALGLVFAFHPTIFSGFRLMQTDIGDTVLCNYIVEHSYRWLTGATGGAGYWNPPVFFPARNVLAYSEILLGGAPLYWPFRLAGFAPDTACQLWMMSLLSLNYGAAFLWLRRGFGASAAPAALGAFVFGFAGARLAQLGHLQMMAQFYMIGAGFALMRIFPAAAADVPAARRRAWILAFFGCVTGELYAGFYLGWFLGLGLGALGLAALLLREPRRRLLALLRQDYLVLLSGALLTALALRPMAAHYLEASRETGFRSYDEVSWLVPAIQTWFYLGPGSWLYFWMRKLKLFGTIAIEGEQRLGLGFVTTYVFVAGLWRERGRTPVRLLAFGFLLVFVMVTKFPPGYWTFWKYLFDWIPGAKAVRALARIGLLGLVPASVGVALYFERRKKWTAGAVALALILLLEQGRTTEYHDKLAAREKVRAIAAAIDRSRCDFFYYSPLISPERRDWKPVRHQLDAMWASLEAGVPTVNGYSGNFPPGWGGLFENQLSTPEQEPVLRARLDEWLRTRALDAGRFCWIKQDF